MNRYNRKLLKTAATGIAVAATAVIVFLPAAAQAAPGTVTSNINVRSGPGGNYGVVDTVRAGTNVDVQQCEGSWCYIAKPGPDGWVSAQYLSAGGRPVNSGQPGLSFGFSTGPGGPQINIGVGNEGRNPPGRPRPPAPPVYEEEIAEVCFYDRTRFRGESQCLEEGESVRNLGGFADRISSIDNPDGLRVQVCAEVNFRNCRTYTTSASSLGDYDDYIASIRVR
ncbi:MULTISPECIES: SH3 domain-containing protein [unclassified Devosia]|uniref:SH3 domain-containing protein n=1 Tax=unclassified Devosia TaxID=196773 RepID=UPI0015546B5C|nr:MULTISPECIES: SH3 domain-containing protein [unclassified Devosia]